MPSARPAANPRGSDRASGSEGVRSGQQDARRALRRRVLAQAFNRPFLTAGSCGLAVRNGTRDRKPSNMSSLPYPASLILPMLRRARQGEKFGRGTPYRLVKGGGDVFRRLK